MGNWEILKLPAIAESDSSIPISLGKTYERRKGEALHQAREPKLVLNQIRVQMGSVDFAAQYQQEPTPPSGNMIAWNWFQIYDTPPPVNQSDRLIVSWDTAISAKELADYSACVVAKVVGESVYILDVSRARLDYPSLKRKVLEAYQRWRNYCSKCELLIENHGSGMSLIQDLRANHIHAIAIDPIGDKVMRMAEQSARIEAGAVFLPARAPWLDEFRGELLAFPAGTNDDQVDALSQLLQRAFKPRRQRWS